MSEQPALIIHTGDITHLSKPGEFDRAQQMFAQLRTGEMHTVPGEHDVADPAVSEYFNRGPHRRASRRLYRAWSPLLSRAAPSVTRWRHPGRRQPT
jgi:3',5'-cyclic AMP phosphodiesterase CpdA